jgi:hypothetical protein
VLTATTPKVVYAYATSSGTQFNYSRLIGVTYPGGTQVSYVYSSGLYPSSSGVDNAISRITSVDVGGTAVETYEYLGLSMITGMVQFRLFLGNKDVA